MGSIQRARRTNFGYARPVALALSRPRLCARAILVVAEAFRSFFYPQFENLVLRRRAVVNVDHPIDLSIAFDPSYMKKYMEFIRLWMGTFYRLGSLYGDRAQGELCRFVDCIRGLYADAGSIYTTVHTTTTRPSKNYSFRFALIHALDPHLDCVPSLHIILMIGNWMLARAAVERLGAGNARDLDKAEVELWIESLHEEALAITESVLFVKQHSVNCVAASLYYLKRRFPAFGEAQAAAFVAALFGSGKRGPANAPELRAVILEVCRGMDAAYALCPARGWRLPMLEFIDSFAS